MSTAKSAGLTTYRCLIRAHNQAPAIDPALQQEITLKATDAVAAMRLASIVTGCAVIDAERQDSIVCAEATQQTIPSVQGQQ